VADEKVEEAAHYFMNGNDQCIMIGGGGEYVTLPIVRLFSIMAHTCLNTSQQSVTDVFYSLFWEYFNHLPLQPLQCTY
jgi:hypothetical protein